MSAHTYLKSWLADAVETRGVDPALVRSIESTASACAEISQVLRTAPIAGISGSASTENVQGETQKQLDVISNDIFIKHLRDNPDISILVSEELDEPLILNSTGNHAVCCDPLDGSSNLDVNVTVGSIFSVLAAKSEQDLLQAGNQQLAAGYAAYGNSTSFVICLAGTVAIFTLDVDGQFVLTKDRVEIPTESAEFAINTARERFWDAPTRAYVADSVAGESGPLGKRYNMRWVGSMVADIHRILMRGGIFLYPLDSETVRKGGRLRLMYEASPMAMLVEAAGGGGTTGKERILDLVPTGIHQRVPVILGSLAEVQRIERHYRS